MLQLTRRRRGPKPRSGAAILTGSIAFLFGCGLSVNGVPVECRGGMTQVECVDRATSALTHSLPPGHPPVARVVVTCDVAVCDHDEGPGQVIVHYTNGEREVVEWGFGHT